MEGTLARVPKLEIFKWNRHGCSFFCLLEVDKAEQAKKVRRSCTCVGDVRKMNPKKRARPREASVLCCTYVDHGTSDVRSRDDQGDMQQKCAGQQSSFDKDCSKENGIPWGCPCGRAARS